jgi:hypothetical protein
LYFKSIACSVKLENRKEKLKFLIVLNEFTHRIAVKKISRIWNRQGLSHKQMMENIKYYKHLQTTDEACKVDNNQLFIVGFSRYLHKEPSPPINNRRKAAKKFGFTVKKPKESFPRITATPQHKSNRIIKAPSTAFNPSPIMISENNLFRPSILKKAQTVHQKLPQLRNTSFSPTNFSKY